MNACVYRFRCCFICVSVPLFICLYVLLGGWVHVSRGQAVPVKGVTLPMYSVAAAFFGLHFFLCRSPFSFFFCLHTCLSLYALIFVRCIRKKHTCLWDASGGERDLPGKLQRKFHRLTWSCWARCERWGGDPPALWALRGHQKLGGQEKDVNWEV